VPARAHLVGIAERGMSGLAHWLAQRGVVVTGSEPRFGAAAARLGQLGVRVHAGCAPSSCVRQAHLLVYSPRTPRDHPERLKAARRGIVQASAAQVLSRLMGRGIGLVVAGRHDASVTAAMIGWTLTRAGLDPTVILGASAPQLGGWARLGEGAYCVVEAIETPEAFAPQAPRLAVLLNGAAGPGPAAALRRLVASVPRDGRILAVRPDAAIETAVVGVEDAVEWLSLERRGGWWGADLREERGRYRFRAFHRGRFAVEVRLQVAGRRHVLSALAAVAACDGLDIPTPVIQSSLEEFAGLARDFQSRGSFRGVTLVDDGASEAAAVAEALTIGRQMFGARRLWAVVDEAGGQSQPCDAARWVAALHHADRVLIAEPPRARPSSARPTEAQRLAHALRGAGVVAEWVAGLNEGIAVLDRHLEPGDVLLTLGSGDVGMIADAFVRRLSHDRHGR
jgi:UDP-N-acetylmuramate--alanine ligase